MLLRSRALLGFLPGLVAVAGCDTSLPSGHGSGDGSDEGLSGSGGAGYGETYGSSGSGGWSGDSSSGTGTGSVGVDQPAPVPPPPEPPACGDLDPSTPLVLYLSSDDSNSMATPARVREILRGVGSPIGPLAGVRTYEFLNYYRIAYPAPPQGALALFAEGTATGGPGEYALQLAVRAYDAPAVRRPMTLTFVLDTSGSMAGEGMERERAAVKAIASRLRVGDVVNAVTWDTAQNVLLANHAATGPADPALASLVANLTASGGTDLHAGLVKGYQLAESTYDPLRMNRLVLISDGGANVGVTDEALIGQKSELGDDEGIYLVGIGTGPSAAYFDTLMDVVTDAGRGAYVYLDSAEEAQRILAARFDEVMEVAARSVQVELELPWYFQMQKFYGEQYSTNAAEVKPQHLAPGDAMVLTQRLKACDPTLVSPADGVTVRVTWQEPITHLAREATLSSTVGELTSGGSPSLAKGLAIVAYAEALKAGDAAALGSARATVRAANPGGTDGELAEIDELLTSVLGY